MRATLALIWKEWREQRWFLFAALAVFLGLPLLEAASRDARVVMPGMPPASDFHSDMPAGLVLGFGGLLAIFVAVGSTTRDLREGVLGFWRSRPIGVGTWLTAKYGVGLLVVLAACTVPMLMQAATGRHTGRTGWDREVLGVVGCHTFALVLIYSLAFLTGCLVRHATHAALLSMAAGLMVYFLPMVVPPLGSCSVLSLMMAEPLLLDGTLPPDAAGWSFELPSFAAARLLTVRRELVTFAAAMLGGSIAAALLAWVVVRRDWRLEADRKVMYWSLGGVALLLFGATSYQIGSNLVVERQFDLPGPTPYAVAGMAGEGTRGVLLLRDRTEAPFGNALIGMDVCRYELTPDGGVRYGTVLPAPELIRPPAAWEPPVLFWRPQKPGRAHLLVDQSRNEDLPDGSGNHFVVTRLELHTLDLDAPSNGDPLLHRLDLKPVLPTLSYALAHQVGDRLLVASYDAVAVIDLAAPDGPRLEMVADMTEPVAAGADPTVPLGRFGRRTNVLQAGPSEFTDAAGRAGLDVLLPPLPGLTPRQRLAAKFSLVPSGTRAAFDANTDLLASTDDGRAISVYRLLDIDDRRARFERVGQREPTPLERATGTYTSTLSAVGGLLYAQQSRMTNGLAVYDLSDPTRPRTAGHFALPGAPALHLAPLPNGRVLCAADRLYVLAPPIS